MKIINNKSLVEDIGVLTPIDIKPGSNISDQWKIVEPFYEKLQIIFVDKSLKELQSEFALAVTKISSDDNLLTSEGLQTYLEELSEQGFDEFSRIQNYLFYELIGRLLRNAKIGNNFNNIDDLYYVLEKDSLEVNDRINLSYLYNAYVNFFKNFPDPKEIIPQIGNDIKALISQIKSNPEQFKKDADVDKDDSELSLEDTNALSNPPIEITDLGVLKRIYGYRRVADKKAATNAGDFWIDRTDSNEYRVWQMILEKGKLKPINITREVSNNDTKSVDQLYKGVPLDATTISREKQIDELLKNLYKYLTSPEDCMSTEYEDIGFMLKLRMTSYMVGRPIKDKKGNLISINGKGNDKNTPDFDPYELVRAWYDDCWNQTNVNQSSSGELRIGNRYMIECYYIERVALIGDFPEKIKSANTAMTSRENKDYQKIYTETLQKIFTAEVPGILGRVKKELTDFYYEYTSDQNKNNPKTEPSDKSDGKLHNRDQLVDGMMLSSVYTEKGNKFWYVWQFAYNNSVDTVNLYLKKVYFNNIPLPSDKVEEFAKDFGNPYKPKVGEVLGGEFYIGEYNPKTHSVNAVSMGESLLKENIEKDSLGIKYSFDDMCEIINKSSQNEVKQRKLSIVNEAARALNKGDYLDEIVIVKLLNKSKLPSLFDYNDMREFDDFIQYAFTTEEGTVSVIECYMGQELFLFLDNEDDYIKYKEIVGG